MLLRSLAVREDGLSHLGASLEATLAQIGQREIADLLTSGFTTEELVRWVAATPPFNSALAEIVNAHLLAQTA